MRIAFFIFKSNLQFAGGFHLLAKMIEEMNTQGHDCFLTENVNDVAKADFVVLSKTSSMTDSCYHATLLLNKPFAFIPFHEDLVNFDRVQKAFFYHLGAVTIRDDQQRLYDELVENPEIIHYNEIVPDNSNLFNFPIYKNANFVVANSPTEKNNILRSCRSTNVKTIYLAPRQFSNKMHSYSDGFLKLVKGLQKGSYILQIGGLEMRKNQLGTIFATKDLDIPLVLLASETFMNSVEYEKICIEAIKKFRKAPTYLLSYFLDPYEDKNLKIIRLKKEKFTDEILASAYQNAGLYFHPAFSALPGYVYLEAAKIGTPIVASHWATIKDYFIDDKGDPTLNNQIAYVKPYDLVQMKNSIENLFGKNFPTPNHPIFLRNEKDLAFEFLQAIEETR